MNKPAVCFICPSYNHEKYVAYFINSVLSQSNPNWELIIIDDNSSDQTVSEIKKFSDERISLLQNEYNKGLAFGLTRGINLTKSNIICFVASDDIVLPQYVETVVKTFENKDVAVMYTPMLYMDEHNNLFLCKDEHGKLLPARSALDTNANSQEHFVSLWLGVNSLPSPGMAFRKSAMLPFLPLDASLVQYSVWQIHLLLLYNNQLSISGEPIIVYRAPSNNSASTRSQGVCMREHTEMPKLMNTAINLFGHNVPSFTRYFGKHPIIKQHVITPETIPFWLGRLALTSAIPVKQWWGYETIMNFITVPANLDLLHSLYGFTYSAYRDLAPVPPKELLRDHYK